MGKQQHSNLLQGTLDLLILKALALGELHGLGISRRVEQMTRGTFLVKPGSLFPALHRMEEAGWFTMGRVREQSQSQVLRIDQGGQDTAGRGKVRVGPDFGSDSMRPGELARTQ